MTRTLILALLLCVASAWSAPVPFPKPKKKPAVVAVAGTTWIGDGFDATPTTYTFNKDGTLTYSHSGSSYGNSHWKQTGEKIYWEHNKRFAEFDGVITGDEIVGRVWNVRGKSANLRIKRQTPR